MRVSQTCQCTCPTCKEELPPPSDSDDITLGLVEPSDHDSVDDLAEDLEYLNVQAAGPEPAFRALEMLGDNEVRMGTRVLVTELIRLVMLFYVVIHGRMTGVFSTWALASEQVNGFPHNVHMRFKAPEEALGKWTEACMQGLVRNPVHPSSLFPKLVSDGELQCRADEANVRAHLATAGPRTNTPVNNVTTALTVASTIAPTTALTVAPTAASTATSTTASSTSTTSTAVDSIADTAVDTSSDAVIAAIIAAESDLEDFVDAPVDVPADAASANVNSPFLNGETIERLWSAKRKGKGKALQPTAGYVVIRGRRPGVYYDVDDWRDAMARGKGGWAFPCKSAESAEELFARFSDEIDVVD